MKRSLLQRRCGLSDRMGWTAKAWGALTMSALVASAVPSAAFAQVVRGTVVHSDSVSPVQGVLVEVRSQKSGPFRTLTDARGGFTISLPAEDSVIVRVLRIGFRWRNCQARVGVCPLRPRLSVSQESRELSVSLSGAGAHHQPRDVLDAESRRGGGMVRRGSAFIRQVLACPRHKKSRGLSVSLSSIGAHPCHATFWTRNLAEVADCAGGGSVFCPPSRCPDDTWPPCQSSVRFVSFVVNAVPEAPPRHWTVRLPSLRASAVEIHLSRR
jgi:hypothetical protein